MGILKIPVPNLSEDELREKAIMSEKLSLKMKEYRQKFNDDITTEFLPMTMEEIIKNIDKCIKHNRKWEGYIVPEVDENDLI